MPDDPFDLVMLAVVLASVLAGVVRYVTFDPARSRPGHADPRLVRALELANAGRTDEALALWEEVIRTGNPPGRATAHTSRAALRLHAGDVDTAVADLDEAIRLAPRYADPYIYRAAARFDRGEFDAALADAEAALRLEPESPHARNDLAWMLATCPEDRLRDGPRAVRLAKEACDLTEGRQPDCLGTLAAAHAECGDFAEALRHLTLAIELGPDGENAVIRQEMLTVFRRGEPYRDDPIRNGSPPS